MDLNATVQVVQSLGLVDDVDPNEVFQIANEIGDSDIKKIAQTLAYIRKRLIEKKSRYEARRY